MEEIATNVTIPLVSACSIPANVKSPGFMLESINAVYGARTISNTIENIGWAYPMRNANKMLRANKCHGFSASVIGPPNTRNNCQMVIRNRMHHAVYCMMVKAFVINGKYSSIATMSVPRAFKKIPDIVSIIDVTMLAIQLTIPSKIQSRIILTSKVYKKSRH